MQTDRHIAKDGRLVATMPNVSSRQSNCFRGDYDYCQCSGAPRPSSLSCLALLFVQTDSSRSQSGPSTQVPPATSSSAWPKLLSAPARLDAPSFANANGLSLRWPLEIDDRTKLKNDYAQFNAVVANRYHTGLDLNVPLDSIVVAAAAGHVVVIQENNAVSCGGGPSTGCEDHGLGHTVFVRHITAAGQTFYTQYSHLASIEAALLTSCGPVDLGTDARHTCAAPVPVAIGERLGRSGASGYGSASYWSTPHLHFELKTFSTLGSNNDLANWGYSADYPDTYGWIDPVASMHATTANSPATRFQVVTATSLRVGPGGSGATEYRSIRQLAAGELYDVVRAAPATVTSRMQQRLVSADADRRQPIFGHRVFARWHPGRRLGLRRRASAHLSAPQHLACNVVHIVGPSRWSVLAVVTELHAHEHGHRTVDVVGNADQVVGHHNSRFRIPRARGKRGRIDRDWF